MASTKRDLIKGTLRAPPLNPFALSSTQVPASRNEISVRRSKEKDIPVVVEFSSTAVPQPFLDPSILQRRIQAEKQWKIEQEKKSNQGEGSSSSGRA